MEDVTSAAQEAVEGGEEGGGVCGICGSITSCIVSIVCCLCIAVVLVVVLVWNFVIRTVDAGAEAVGLDDFSNVLDNIQVDVNWDDIWSQEPGFTGGPSGTLNRWETDAGQQGLQLEIYNALDSTWQDIFAEAVADWQDSEALTLSTTEVTIDRECQFVDGVMKACNANYGDTNWVGLNEVELIDGYITASVAKLNEYYLRNADYYKRRYTMCHELGHGFGLPHTDENFNNANLGNCLDYTDNAQAADNYLPGEMNFEKLRELYLQGSTSTNTNNGATTSAAGEAGEGNERGLRRRVVVRRYFSAEDAGINYTPVD